MHETVQMIILFDMLAIFIIFGLIYGHILLMLEREQRRNSFEESIYKSNV